MRLESSSRSFQMTARKTSISPDFPFRNTIRYFDSDQMLEESKSLSKRKLQVEHSGGRESKVQRKQTQKRNKLQTSYQTNTSPLLFFVLFVSFLLKYARTSEGSAPASRAGALANRVRSARFALAKRARSARAVFIRWWVGYFAGSAIRVCHVSASASPSVACLCLYVWTSVCGLRGCPAAAAIRARCASVAVTHMC